MRKVLIAILGIIISTSCVETHINKELKNIPSIDYALNLKKPNFNDLSIQKKGHYVKGSEILGILSDYDTIAVAVIGDP